MCEGKSNADMTKTEAELRDKYIIEEMKVARTRMDQEIDAMNKFEVLSLTAIGAIFALILQYAIYRTSSMKFIALLPAVISFYGLYRGGAHADVIKLHEGYIKKIECKIYGCCGGLVKYYDDNKRSKLRSARKVFWLFMLIFTSAITLTSFLLPELVFSSLPPQPQK